MNIYRKAWDAPEELSYLEPRVTPYQWSLLKWVDLPLNGGRALRGFRCVDAFAQESTGGVIIYLQEDDTGDYYVMQANRNWMRLASLTDAWEIDMADAP